MPDRRLRADGVFFRAQSVMSADGFLSVQNRNSATTGGAIQVATYGMT
jgi:hypothetical protein